MKLKEKIKAYIVKTIREETEELKNRENLLEENVRNLNTIVAGQEVIAENVRNLNAAMEGYDGLAENVRNLNVMVAGQEAIAENVRNLNAVLGGYDGLVENVRNLNAAMEGQDALIENVRNLNAAMEGQDALAENVRNLNAAMEGQDALAENVRNLNAAMEGQDALAENVRNLNVMLEGYDGLLENVRNLNGMFQNFKNEIDILKNNKTMIETRRLLLEMRNEKSVMLENAGKTQTIHTVPKNDVKNKEEISLPTEDVYLGIDYFDFENHFRGSMEQIKRNQEQYIKYYEGRSNVIDLGCGRGEFLELLKENGIKAKGVDLYEEFAQMCQMNGLDVICDDALHFLDSQQNLGGIFAAQLIEHLTINQLVELCRLAYEKLEEGACIVMETPNPRCLSIFSHAFYVDPSHNKPVHPLTIEYILQQSGFTDIEVLYTSTSRHTCTIPAISGIENAVEFNEAMHTVSEILFGSQDYAVVARKH